MATSPDMFDPDTFVDEIAASASSPAPAKRAKVDTPPILVPDSGDEDNTEEANAKLLEKTRNEHEDAGAKAYADWKPILLGGGDQVKFCEHHVGVASLCGALQPELDAAVPQAQPINWVDTVGPLVASSSMLVTLYHVLATADAQCDKHVSPDACAMHPKTRSIPK
jgi:hypothetical protein